MGQEYAVCSVFGCSKPLSLHEQLCGSVCSKHSTVGTVVDSINTDFLNKRQAIKAMEAGVKVHHITFTDDEWIMMKKLNNSWFIETECAYIVRNEEFWKYHRSDIWESNWKIVND